MRSTLSRDYLTRRSCASLLFPHRIVAHWAIPGAFGLALETNTSPMKPFVKAVVVVASNHVAIAHVLTEAIFYFIPLVFIIHCKVREGPYNVAWRRCIAWSGGGAGTLNTHDCVIPTIVLVRVDGEG